MNQSNGEGDYPNQGSEVDINQNNDGEEEYSQGGGDSVTNETETRPQPGYCQRCGFSLYHYAGKPCSADPERRKHPEWTRKPPPSFAEANK
mmetsp:Transcript_16564/g.21485  ORF Transcript_16564/g.21485 Transcript_16564/m.21485 type:complete len:91 (+) Transcript_16564:157-429(+)